MRVLPDALESPNSEGVRVLRSGSIAQNSGIVDGADLMFDITFLDNDRATQAIQ